VNNSIHNIAFGGGCHWCTEAVFSALTGVELVKQGYVASTSPNESYSEAVVVHFNAELIPLKVLIEIHLHTHNSQTNHSMRDKYRSAIYCSKDSQHIESMVILERLQEQFDANIITQVLPFVNFKPARESIQEYYLKHPEAPFCKRYISPKIKYLEAKYAKHLS